MKKVIVLLIAITACSCSMHKPNKVRWSNDINNPDNEEFVTELAFNLEISKDKVTQTEFNERYLN